MTDAEAVQAMRDMLADLQDVKASADQTRLHLEATQRHLANASRARFWFGLSCAIGGFAGGLVGSILWRHFGGG